MFSIEKLNSIIRCFNEIEDFYISVGTQEKMVSWLKDTIQKNNRLQGERRKLAKKVEELTLKMSDSQKMYQSVIFKLSNGKTYVFTGPAIEMIEGEDILINDIKFTRPKELPKGMEFSVFPEEELEGERNG